MLATCMQCGILFPSKPCHAGTGRGKHCSMRCRYSRTLEDRLWAKVNKSGPVPLHRPALGPCWLWQGSVDGSGYGRIGLGKTTVGAHRLALAIDANRREIITGPQLVLHRCDNPPCCNPKHLFLGDDAANAADRVSKGRNGDLRGERNGRAKLSDADVAAIRSDKRGGIQLASAYNVHPDTIYSIRRQSPGVNRHRSRVARGERCRSTKLTPAEAERVIALRGTGATQLAVAKDFGISRSAVGAIWRGELWDRFQR